MNTDVEEHKNKLFFMENLTLFALFAVLFSVTQPSSFTSPPVNSGLSDCCLSLVFSLFLFLETVPFLVIFIISQALSTSLFQPISAATFLNCIWRFDITDSFNVIISTSLLFPLIEFELLPFDTTTLPSSLVSQLELLLLFFFFFFLSLFPLPPDDFLAFL